MRVYLWWSPSNFHYWQSNNACYWWINSGRCLIIIVRGEILVMSLDGKFVLFFPPLFSICYFLKILWGVFLWIMLVDLVASIYLWLRSLEKRVFSVFCRKLRILQFYCVLYIDITNAWSRLFCVKAWLICGGVETWFAKLCLCGQMVQLQ